MDFYNFDYSLIQQHVLDFMRQNGIIPYDQNMTIIIDGSIHRFRTQDDAHYDTSGSYCIFSEIWPAGWVQDWRIGSAIKWSFPRDSLNLEGQSFFDDERYKKAIEASKKRQQELLQLQKEKEVKASEIARIQFEAAPPAPQNHTYLKNKNVPVLGLHSMHDALVVPLRDAEGRFMVNCSIIS